ncbi:cytochrome c oxidase accessory protein CcoG [Luminiphilus syltensis NOR5-1B]|uniref:Cytochrome c oxidase accessory protein CcoG n=1 Tax=Luminiphilus syltensis NOR5-1B TaxID=565045 RepID=B8KR16_9GAMM|nr:cytochrome c oxidase accessory protein CcoG [Luminiphilus syltensis]EED34597.1 cytochrome c oxidase accessory protein CcoG [Luminiphilus syltensis NOR5-1B]
MDKKPPDIIAVDEVAPAEVAEVDLYQRREKVYTRNIEGFFQRVRLYSGWPMLIAYFGVPWLMWGDRQAVLFDLPERKFHIFMLTFWPQDLVMLAFLLIIAAFALFTVTVFAGRVWCGYTCPQTVFTAIFMWIEQKFEGSRNQRMKLDKQPWSFSKVRKKLTKHAGWVTVAFLTGITFIGYFTPIGALFTDFFTGNAGSWAFAWTLFFTCATYINAGWMREQVCTYMCPYARFQSVMFDRDTLIVSYDPERGEPRGSRKRSGNTDAILGDCIDCQLCVQVCPTGIDIRDGLQYQCIGCALCIDACNSIMDKMNYPRGLVSYTSENALEGKPSTVLRPRLVGYLLVLAVMTAVFSYTIFSRDMVDLTIFRDRNQLYMAAPGGLIDNVYRLHLSNRDTEDHQYQIEVGGIDGVEVIGVQTIAVASGELVDFNLRLRANPVTLSAPGTEVTFTATQVDDPSITITSESRFIKPL